ncbi:MAG: hypothetical protein HOP11_10085 [Saprospiraceae bacterium]|nr:hypothetical protein [Saprospiraceae bacterium]
MNLKITEYDLKVFELFQILSKTEKKKFELFLNSPYFNTRKDLIRLYEAFFEREKLDNLKSRKDLYNFIYPTKKYNDADLRQVCNAFHNELKFFLSIDQFNKDSRLHQLKLIDSLKTRTDKEIFDRYLPQDLNDDFLSSTNLYYKYQFQLERFEFNSKLSRKDTNHLNEASHSLNEFCITETLRLACHFIANTNILKEEIQLLLLDFTLEYSKSHFKSLNKLNKFYYLIYNLNLDFENTAEYSQLKEYFLNEISSLEFQTKKEITLMLINYCIRQINTGKTQFNNEAFTFYKTGLEESLLIEKKQMSVFTYKNIASLAMTSGKYTWAENFLNEYKSFLPKKERENAYQFNISIFYFRQNKYDEAMALLRSVEFKDVFDNLMSRRMLLRIYLEKDYTEALESLLESFNTYLRRQYKLVYHKIPYKKLIQYVKKYIQIPGYAIEEFHDLIKTIRNDSVFPEKNWFIEYIERKNINRS